MQPRIWRATTSTLLSALGISGSVIAAIPDLSKQLATCAAIEGDLARLECYDMLAKSLGPSRPTTLPTAVTGNGKWSVRTEQNEPYRVLRRLHSLRGWGHGNTNEVLT